MPLAARIMCVVACLLMASCSSVAQLDFEPPEAWSLVTGRPLYPPELADEHRASLEADLAAAKAAYDRDPTGEEATIWYGRRLAYLGRYRGAIRVFERGLESLPESYRIRRHLGHRLITVRRFDDAAGVLHEAATLVRGLPDEVEPDGAPNALNIPRSTTQSNICYHLGLAHFLMGDYEAALAAYRACLEVSVNDDMWCATAHWMWMTFRRLGRDEEAAALLAPVREDMEIIENTAYHRLLVMYKCGIEPTLMFSPIGYDGLYVRLNDGKDEDVADAIQDSALVFGVANWLLVNGDPAAGLRLCSSIVECGPWPAFGAIAAEVDLARAGFPYNPPPDME